MANQPEWTTSLRAQHRELVVRRDELKSRYGEHVQHQSRKSRSKRKPSKQSESTKFENKGEGRKSVDRSRELEQEREYLNEKIRGLYTGFLDRVSDSDDEYQEQIQALLRAFQYNISTTVVASVVGCSKGHARRFEWDSKHQIVREKAWSRKQRKNQAPPLLNEEVRTRDDQQCVRCGSSTEIVVHHIEPAGQYGPAVMDNLATLCPQCHSAAHGGDVSSGEVIYDSAEAFWNWTRENDR